MTPTIKIALLSAYISIIGLVIGVAVSKSASHQNQLLLAQIKLSSEYLDYALIEREPNRKSNSPLTEIKRAQLATNSTDFNVLAQNISNIGAYLQLLSLGLVIAQLKLLEIVVIKEEVAIAKWIIYFTNAVFLISILGSITLVCYLILKMWF